MRWQSGPLRLAILTEMPLFTGINHYPLVTERFKYSCVKLLLLLQLVERTNYDIRESIAFNLHCFLRFRSFIHCHTPASIVNDALLYLMEAKFWQS